MTTAAATRSAVLTRTAWVSIGLAAFTIFMRFPTLVHPILDWDVGLYTVIADQVAHGHLPYTTAWEYKPPGFFLLMAAALVLFPNPHLALGLLADGAIVAVALAIRRIAERVWRADGATMGFAAAAFYICLTVENDGLTGDTELFIAPFLALAILIVLPVALREERLGAGRTIAFGLAAAAAVQMKLTALPIAASLVVYAAYLEPAAAVRTLLVCAGCIGLPFGLEVAVYAGAHQLAAFLDANWFATLRRIAARGHGTARTAEWFLRQMRIMGPTLELAVFAPFVDARERGLRGIGRPSGLIWTWLATEWITIAIVGEYDLRHFLETLAPLSLAAAYVTVRIGERLRRPRTIVTIVVLTTFGLHGYYLTAQVVKYLWHRVALHQANYGRHAIENVAMQLRRDLRGGRTLYVADETPSLYVMTGAPLPTRYPYMPHLAEPDLAPTVGIDGRAETRRILARRPDYVVVAPFGAVIAPWYVAMVDAALRRGYVRESQTSTMTVCVRRELAAPGLHPPCRTHWLPREHG